LFQSASADNISDSYFSQRAINISDSWSASAINISDSCFSQHAINISDSCFSQLVL
jgi:hypothetical protein